MFSVKQLFAGIVLLVVVGIAGFLYRNALVAPGAVPGDEQVACTADAKICPDGTAVGRQGPNCEFAACKAPNVELASIGTAFVLPTGYAENRAALGSDTTLIAAYEKPGKTPPDAIVVRRFLIPEGDTAEDVILENTMDGASGLQPESMSAFTAVTIGDKTFQKRVIERFEAQVHSVYYLVRATDVLRFEVLERDVLNWTEPTLVVEELPEHAAFLRMLATLQVAA